MAASGRAPSVGEGLNRGSVVQVHAFGHTWTGHLYRLLVLG
jgi:hypothetical protein